MTPAINCSVVSTTPAINPCHGFSMIAGDNNTSDKFITADTDTGEQLLPVTMTPAINLSLLTTTPVNNYCR
jgi:hypothetical protein